MDASNGSQDTEQTLDSQVKAFFDSAPPLQNRNDIIQKLNHFIQLNSLSSENGIGKRIVCVTSGGTTAPLEQRCVRYVDNFSSGHRGATSTEYLFLHLLLFLFLSMKLFLGYLFGDLLEGNEYYVAGYVECRYFLKAGYAVIFLYRRGSFQPFCRSLPDDPLLECFEATEGLNIQVREAYSKAVKTAIVDHHAAVDSGLLLKLPFSTIFEYLQMLQIISKPMKDIGPRAMFYLAAAVSDFYVPWKDMVEHKIQSGSHILDVKLVPVPKMLSVLRKDWAPLAFCISFKLETDSNILLNKARGALEKYNMHAVVANELSTRKEQVVVVTIDDKITVQRDKSKADDDVENPLIKLLSQRHSAYIEDPKRMR
ncbi:phosphopantothenate--cysteine ligase 2 isoform X1 [Arachis duranensis]|uniref:Phosphopantothenate--cysteine ligase 2 isoform X1 n=1 Tax=Arachis duranensis TaxID=130453 RepID=A0A6P4CBG5_ARADU|nr:phosphopantothenate--cysteine ligase 2 isoform X1 [Arachis duranensis]XP_015948420.1 phosphopantothenate--cysteine ligase 2 isoform X1 [Arachis duranensis]